jgi:hypothetical protein
MSRCLAIESIYDVWMVVAVKQIASYFIIVTMKSKFEEIERGQFIITLIPESLDDVDFLGLYNDMDKKQNNILYSYYNQAIKRQFAKEAYITYFKPYTDYPRSVLAFIKFPVQQREIIIS